MTCEDAVHPMLPLVWIVLESRGLLNVRDGSRPLGVDPEIPLSVVTQTVEISTGLRTLVLLSVCPSLTPFLSFLQPCTLPACSLPRTQSRELLIQFPFKCVERCCRLPSCSIFALCFPPQGCFLNWFDLCLWFIAVTDFFVAAAAAATVSLQLGF